MTNIHEEYISTDTTTLRVERRSVGYIPARERHGKPFSQFTLWFGANLQITALVTGALAYVLGGDVVWSIVGLFLGQLGGGTVMALHSAQGPRLGLPQMISSRAQFGVYGAAIPLVLIILMYLGFSASGTLLAGQAVSHLFGAPSEIGIIAFGAMSAIAAIIGYRVIHAIGRWATVISSITFTYLIVQFFIVADVGALFAINEFSIPSFLLAAALSASWQMAYGPYVADYSRYLPKDSSEKQVFGWTLAGTVLSSQIAMTFGVLVAAYAGEQFDGNEVSTVVGLVGGGLIASIVYIVIAFGKLAVNVLNTYGGFMSVVTAYSGFTGKAEIKQAARITAIVVMSVIAVLVALWGRGQFLSAFSSFLLFLLTFFTPWSAINLIDFYWISKEKYDVPALSDPKGRYGAWNIPALLAFGLGVLMQLPFVATGFFEGPLVAALDGADISWIVGLIGTSIVYWLLRPLDKREIPTETILPAEDQLLAAEKSGHTLADHKGPMNRAVR